MEQIKEFTVGLIIVCVLGAIIIILTPEGTIEKQVKTAVSLVMLLCFIYPFCSGIELDFSFDIPVETESKISSDELFIDTFRTQLISDIKEYLSENDINVSDIEIAMHTTDENEILIESVIVYLFKDSKLKTEITRQLIKNKFGIDSRTEVCYESENQQTY